MDGLLRRQVERLLADPTLGGAQDGVWPTALWSACESLGLPLAMAPERAGGAGLGWQEAGAVWLALGRHAAPVPLGEAMLAGSMLDAAVEADGPVLFAGDTEAVAWGRAAAAVVTARGEVVPAARLEWEHGTNLAGEPRDRWKPAMPAGDSPLPLALLRAAQIAGALERVLELSVEYANTRQQFGRAIGGFQAVQQQLATLAEEAACCGVAVATALRAADRVGLAGAAFEIACAKIVAGEAAGTGAAIGHAVHGAIGITDEYALHPLTCRLWAWRDEGGSERYWAQRIGADAIARGGAALWPDLTARGEMPA